ncbi:DNA polymerase eta-like protein [Dinothrombium tinctorium]|uniref:DNA polymerase eta n=1 Tax=Dinothrombium tinctorium TaxID=1965070 RepID=A0A3S3PLS0_9ACAR|nr:DNA polymerase eta-like protein [Dinothrombium tinctorium]RWS12316.1 DNA polymerase eta-like protein [Dinothrombium tinctorium]
MAAVIALLDMDCFYVQVEQRLEPSTRGLPAVVVQYNTYKGGGVIAVNYEARAAGVNRFMRGDEAKSHCSQLHVFHVPEQRGKADLTRYRQASEEVLDVICKFNDQVIVERASIDEAFIDLTKLVSSQRDNLPAFEQINTTYLPSATICGKGYGCCLKHFYEHVCVDEFGEHADDNKHLLIAAKIISDLRQQIFEKTGFQCTAGISHSKMLSKLSCSLRKPNGQTMLPHACIHSLLLNTPINKVRNLGGKFGEEVKSKLGVTSLGQITSFTYAQLSTHFSSKTAKWLYSLARGFDGEEVISRQIPKSIGCSKNFPVSQKNALKTKDQVVYWMQQLSEEVIERLKKDLDANRRMAKLITVGMRFANGEMISRSLPLQNYDTQSVVDDIVKHIIVRVMSSSTEPIIMLSLSASKFADAIYEDKCSKIDKFFIKNKNLKVSEMIGKAETNKTTRETEEISSANNSISFHSSNSNTSKPNLEERRGFFYRKTLELAAKRAKIETNSSKN